MSDEQAQEQTLEEKVDYLIVQVAALGARIGRLEREILPQPPDPGIGLP